jgi:hypothetical protein
MARHFKNTAGLRTIGDRRNAEKAESKKPATEIQYVGLVLEDELLNHLAIPESALKLREAEISPSALDPADHGVLAAMTFVCDYIDTYGEAPRISAIAAEVGYQDFYEPQIPVEYLIEKLQLRVLRKAFKAEISSLVRNFESDPHGVASRLGVNPTSSKGNGSGSTGQMQLSRLSEVEYRPVEWLWEGWIPKANLTVVAGEGGIGKSHFLLGLAARLSTGDKINDGLPGNTLILSAEDPIDSVILPRLVAAGADLDRIMEGYISNSHWKQSLAFPDDLDKLATTVRENEIDLVIIDPGSAHLAAVDSHNDQQIRRALGPLAGIAMEQRCAVTYLVHLNKSSGGSFSQRIVGSVGTVNAARSVLGMGIDPEDDEMRVVAHVKANWSEKQSSLLFSFEELDSDIDGVKVMTTRLKFEGVSSVTADDLVAPRERNSPELDRAIEFIEQELSNGPVPSAILNDHADEIEISKGTLGNAKKHLGVISKQVGGTWIVGYREQL